MFKQKDDVEKSASKSKNGGDKIKGFFDKVTSILGMLTAKDDEEVVSGLDFLPEDVREKAKELTERPPDWEKAEMHGKATKIYDRANVVFEKFTKTGDRCSCCNRYIPEDSDKYALCDTDSLRSLGEGFPIFFELMKYIIYLLFF